MEGEDAVGRGQRGGIEVVGGGGGAEVVGEGGGGPPTSVLRTVGLCFIPFGSTRTTRGSPPSFLHWSKTNVATHLRALLMAGRSSRNVGVQQRYGLFHRQVLYM